MDLDLDLDPDRHQNRKWDTDPDRHQNGANSHTTPYTLRVSQETLYISTICVSDSWIFRPNVICFT